MIKQVLPLAVVLAIGACGGAAVVGPPDGGGGGSTTPASSLEGTASRNYVQRYEGTEDAGSARGIVYNATDDTIMVDNLPRDGANSPYRRRDSNPVRNLGGTGAINSGPFRVYEGPDTFPDSATGDPIEQHVYRAIHGESTNLVNGRPRTSFTIVRTGSYAGYGFGGFVFERNGTVAIPRPDNSTSLEAAQGVYTGDYAGVVDFDGAGGATYVQGDARVVIDFQDFNDNSTLVGDAVDAHITGRRYYSLNGTDITSSYLASLSEDLGYDVAAGEGLTTVPVLRFRIQSGGVMDTNGEMEGSAVATAGNSEGEAVEYQSGSYYAVLAGDATTADNEIVGIVVVEGGLGSVTMRETGGFIVYRGAGH